MDRSLMRPAPPPPAAGETMAALRKARDEAVSERDLLAAELAACRGRQRWLVVGWAATVAAVTAACAVWALVDYLVQQRIEALVSAPAVAPVVEPEPPRPVRKDQSRILPPALPAPPPGD